MYALLGVAIVAVGINIMVFACLESGRECLEYCSLGYCRFVHCQSKHLIQRPISAGMVHRRMWLMFFKIVMVIISGALVYMIPGMMEDGQPGLPFVDSLYMCTMTASSIGYRPSSYKSSWTYILNFLDDYRLCCDGIFNTRNIATIP